MFNQDEDWSDEEEAQVLSKTIVNSNLKSNSSKHVKVSTYQFKKENYCIACPDFLSLEACLYLRIRLDCLRKNKNKKV